MPQGSEVNTTKTRGFGADLVNCMAWVLRTSFGAGVPRWPEAPSRHPGASIGGTGSEQSSGVRRPAMQLTEQERRALREMEARLALQDPRLARSLARPMKPRPGVSRGLASTSAPEPGGWLLAIAVALLLALVIALVAAAAGMGGRGVLAIVTLEILLALAAIPSMARAWHRRRRRALK